MRKGDLFRDLGKQGCAVSWRARACRKLSPRSCLTHPDPPPVCSAAKSMCLAWEAKNLESQGETTDYLRMAGALDEQTPSQPVVLIPNYM